MPNPPLPQPLPRRFVNDRSIDCLLGKGQPWHEPTATPWDLATSVGATATGVAVGRALASRAANPLIDDPFAEPLVRAVGGDFFTRLASGELDPAAVDDNNSAFGMRRMSDIMAVRTLFLDELFIQGTTLGFGM